MSLYRSIEEIFMKLLPSPDVFEIEVDELLAYGVDVNAPLSRHGDRTPLQMACSVALVAPAAYGCLAQSASSSGVGDRHLHIEGDFAQTSSVFAYSAFLVDALLRHGADTEVRHKGRQWTAIHYACEFGSARILRSLLAGGADPNARDIRGLTPLWRLAERRFHTQTRKEMLGVLLEHGADPTIRNSIGRTLVQAFVDGEIKQLVKAAIAQRQLARAMATDEVAPANVAVPRAGALAL